jgi:hypothetical protein
MSPAQFQKSFQVPKLSSGNKNTYGMAWRVENYDGKVEHHIVGEGENQRASIQHFVDDDLVIVYVHDHSGEYFEPVYWMIRNIWEGKPFEMPKNREVYPIDKSLYQKYTGSYLGNFGLVHVTHENGRLWLRPDPVPGKEELIPSSNTTFYFKNQDLNWEFYLDEKGDVIGFGIKGDPENMSARQ